MTSEPVSSSAPSKLILLGEHAVVYGHPSAAVPIHGPLAQATARPCRRGAPAAVVLRDFDLTWTRGTEPSAAELAPFARLVDIAVSRGVPEDGWTLCVASSIPIGCGLGSGAAVAAASFRALYGAFGVRRSDAELSDDVFEVEKLLHGSPSGVDNTVIAHGRPVLFRKGEAPAFLDGPARPLYFAVGDTGLRHRTADVVADVARLREAQPGLYDGLFRDIGRLSLEGVQAFQSGDASRLGALMSSNHDLLRRLGVSCPELDALVGVARAEHALGAKLCGAGRGGCAAALARDAEHADKLVEAMSEAGAPRAFTACVQAVAGSSTERMKAS